MSEDKNAMHELYVEHREIERALDAAAKKAFPIGSSHTCTNWRTPVEVEIIAVHGHDNIHVLSETGKEYRTRSTYLGVKYT